MKSHKVHDCTDAFLSLTLVGRLADRIGSDIPEATVRLLCGIATANRGKLMIEAGAHVMTAFTKAAEIISIAPTAG